MKRIFLLLLVFIIVPVSSRAQQPANNQQASQGQNTQEANKKIEESNRIISKALVDGNRAFNENRFDDAIASYDEGLAADNEQATLWINKSLAVFRRGLERYNTEIRAKDEIKVNAKNNLGVELHRALDSVNKGIELLNNPPSWADGQTTQAQRDSLKLSGLGSRAEILRILVTVVDKSLIDDAVAAMLEFNVADTTNPNEKVRRLNLMGRMLFDADRLYDALKIYTDILTEQPENTDALLNKGLLLINIGDREKNESSSKDGLNVLRQFVEKAPKYNEQRNAVLEELTFLENAENSSAPKLLEGSVTLIGPREHEKTEGDSTGKKPTGSAVLNGNALSLPKPTYPAIARLAHSNGTVVIQVILDEEGKVISATPLSGPYLLRRAAVVAAKQARFSTTILNGVPVKITGTINYNFLPQ